MAKIKWIKQLTRENTLLDRSLRAIAYDQSVREIGKASISRCPIVGIGEITSMYYSPADYKNQQKIILKEFSGKNIEKLGNNIANFLEQGYVWAKKMSHGRLNAKEFLEFFNEFNLHHAHARGAIVYGYWGEPAITEQLKKSLSYKLKNKNIDDVLSKLSAPKIVPGRLLEIYHPSKKVEEQKQALLKKLHLNKHEQELVDILSWFTFFYELGERVSSFLYDEFLKHLGSQIKSKAVINELMWYDPKALENYFHGKKLSADEILLRKQMYILQIESRGKLQVLSGQKAKTFYNQNFREQLPINISELKGTIASLGKAVGKVKIIITQADQSKMKQGDILVSTMTTPRLMSAVKRAAAIVTDEGGMTAHAAIVSREFGIPCIVGTKIATKVFRDGDMVEVDANKGTVKKI